MPRETDVAADAASERAAPAETPSFDTLSVTVTAVVSTLETACDETDAAFVISSLPFPPDIPMHDQWLGLLAELTGKVVFLDEVLMLYRRHGSNMSEIRPSGLTQMLIWRVTLVRELWIRGRKIRSEKRS